jgi:phage terminase large subunit-like protein
MIGKEEFLSDYAESKQSLQALADFKMYRLNIWQRAQNPWLRAMDWDRCRQPFAASELEGRTCGAGLDLSISGDMTALSLCFPEPVDEAEPSQDAPVKLVTWYWLPEGALKQYGHLVPLAEWARDGWLTVLPDKKIDQRLVRAKIAEILNRYDVGAFAFDPWMAAQFVKELSEEDGFPIEFCYEFRQGIKTFAAPTAAFERLVVTGKLQHDGNPITAWQAGHVEVLTDPSGNIRPVKPEKQDHRKVDGIVSAVMALDATTRMEGSSAYDSRGQFTVGDILGMSSEPEQEEAMTT